MKVATRRQISPRVLIVGLALASSACTNPYDPVQRTIGGGLIGAGTVRQSALPLPVDTVRPSAPRSAERWVQWAALSLRHRRLGIATRPRTPRHPLVGILSRHPLTQTAPGFRCRPD